MKSYKIIIARQYFHIDRIAEKSRSTTETDSITGRISVLKSHSQEREGLQPGVPSFNPLLSSIVCADINPHGLGDGFPLFLWHS